MLNKDLKLNTKIFDDDVEQVPTRNGYGEGLLEAGEKDENVVALCADLTESTRTHLFAERFPERFVQVGVAEQNMASVASGMAAMGKIPFIASYGMFSPGRNWEQIRTTICYNDTNVKIVGAHAGVSVGPDGGTHQAIEDISLMRVIPRMTVFCPCDAVEAKKAVLEAAKMKGPVYIRLAREKTPIVTTEETPFSISKANVIFDSVGEAEVGIIGTGPLLYNAIIAAKELEEEGVKLKVMNLSTIKPMDSDAVVMLAKEANALVTVEEHQIFGGMGAAVAGLLAEKYPTPIEFIGIKDQFGQSGDPQELIKHYEMDVESIKKAARKVLERKKIK